MIGDEGGPDGPPSTVPDGPGRTRAPGRLSAVARSRVRAAAPRWVLDLLGSGGFGPHRDVVDPWIAGARDLILRSVPVGSVGGAAPWKRASRP